MSFDGSFANDEFLGDLAIAFSLGNQGCHCALPRSQSSKGFFGGAVW